MGIKARSYTHQTLKKLFALSGNQCSFPDCSKHLVNKDNAKDSNICHIEAANSDGERYNKSMTDKQRADYDNLILLCVQHHDKTNNIEIYTVEVLQKMKNNHENTISNKPNKANSIYTQIVKQFEQKIKKLGSRWLQTLPEADRSLLVTEYNNLYNLLEWINTRDWTTDNKNFQLELSFKDLAKNIDKLLSTFNVYVKNEGDYKVTERFYNAISYYDDAETRNKLEEQYDNHIDSLIDFTIEIAKNLNNVFRIIRHDIDRNFLIDIGIIPSLHGCKLD